VGRFSDGESCLSASVDLSRSDSESTTKSDVAGSTETGGQKDAEPRLGLFDERIKP